MEKVYAAIDLKSFYASVECHERGLDPLTTNLVVADRTRTDKTICLAVSPSLKSYGIGGRARLFEVMAKVREINYERQQKAPGHQFTGKSTNHAQLLKCPELELDFIAATPRMQFYLDYSNRIYQTYLQFVAPEDLYAYSIDEVFCDITSYLHMHQATPEEFVTKIIQAVYHATGITATAGIGSNLFLAKVAMDIVAKHTPANRAGVRIASLDEMTFRKQLWSHQPITDFWRVGRGYAKSLANHGIYTMGDVALCSTYHEDLLYQLFGVNAELLIDHSWGYECVSLKDIKNYQPETKSLSSGQVLSRPYNSAEAEIIVKEMAEQLAMELTQKNFLTDQLTLHINYDRSNISNSQALSKHHSEIKRDHYGRLVPKPAHGTTRLSAKSQSCSTIISAFAKLYQQIIQPGFTIRKITLCADNLSNPQANATTKHYTQIDLFTNPEQLLQQEYAENQAKKRESRLQDAVLRIRQKYGKNAILRGLNFEAGATMINRNHQIGGHQA